MGIVNGIANAMGIVVPMVVALMVDGNVSQQIYVATIIRLKFKLENIKTIFLNSNEISFFSKHLQDGEPSI